MLFLSICRNTWCCHFSQEVSFQHCIFLLEIWKLVHDDHNDDPFSVTAALASACLCLSLRLPHCVFLLSQKTFLNCSSFFLSTLIWKVFTKQSAATLPTHQSFNCTVDLLPDTTLLLDEGCTPLWVWKNTWKNHLPLDSVILFLLVPAFS